MTRERMLHCLYIKMEMLLGMSSIRVTMNYPSSSLSTASTCRLTSPPAIKPAILFKLSRTITSLKMISGGKESVLLEPLISVRDVR